MKNQRIVLASRPAGEASEYHETVAEGLPSAPDAFLGLLKGRNFG